MNLRSFILLAACLAVAACTPPAPPPPAAPEPPPVRQRLVELPGAEVDAGEPLRILYPGDSLFAPGAALPLPGGMAVLDPLAAVLVDYPHLRWRGTVRALTGISVEYDRALAEGRAALLRRYFENRGIFGGQLDLGSAAEEGPPLELDLLPVAEAETGEK